MMLICLSNVVIIYFFLADRKKEKKKKIYKTVSSHFKRANLPESVKVGQQKISWLGNIATLDAVYAFCMFFNMISKGSFGAFEAIGVMIAEDNFKLGSEQAGYTVASFGVLGVFALLLMGKFGHTMSDTQMTWIGTIVMTFGALAMVHWPSEELPLSVLRYYFGIFCVYGFGYPVGHTANIGLFSKSKIYFSCQVKSKLIAFLSNSLSYLPCLFFFKSHRKSTPRSSSGMVCNVRFSCKSHLSCLCLSSLCRNRSKCDILYSCSTDTWRRFGNFKTYQLIDYSFILRWIRHLSSPFHVYKFILHVTTKGFTISETFNIKSGILFRSKA